MSQMLVLTEKGKFLGVFADRAVIHDCLTWSYRKFSPEVVITHDKAVVHHEAGKAEFEIQELDLITEARHL